LGLQLDEGAELVGERDVWIDAVQLKQLDAFQAEEAKTLVRLGLEVLGLSVPFPSSGAGSRQAGLRRDHQVARVGRERFVDDSLAHLGSVRVGSVDECDAEVECAAKDTDHFVVVAWIAPYTRPGDLHGAVAKAHHG